MNHKKAMSSAITYGVLVLITIVCLFPIVWMCLISIKDTSESITGFNSILVTHPTLGNFKRLFEMIPVGQNTLNSFHISTVRVTEQKNKIFFKDGSVMYQNC